MSFPTLSPDGKGDPTNSAILIDSSGSITEAFANKLKHLMKFGEKIDGKWVYRFQSHPRFRYWAYNMLYRRRILGQGSYFLKQNPSEANLTLEGLKQMLQSNLCELSQKAHKGYLAGKSTMNKTSEEPPNDRLLQKQQLIEDDKEAERIICKYIDFLMSTENPCNSDEGDWVKPDTHPCKTF